MPTESEIVKAQAEHRYCQNIHFMLGIAPVWVYTKTGLLCRKSLVDGSSQVIVLLKYQTTVLYSAYFPKLAKPPDVRRMYDSLGRQYYWSYTPMDVQTLVLQRRLCRRRRPSETHQQLHKLFPSSVLLEIIAIDILELLQQTKQGNQFIVVLTDRFTKLTRAHYVTKSTAPHVATVVLEHWAKSSGAPGIIITKKWKAVHIKVSRSAMRFNGHQDGGPNGVQPPDEWAG